MELFAVQRYTAEPEQIIAAPKANEADILQKLLKKAEKRKRKQDELTAAAAQLDKRSKSIEKAEIALQEAEEEVAAAAAAVTPSPAVLEQQTNANANATDFAVLGEDANAVKQQKVAVVLPAWLAHPTIVSTSIAADVDLTADINQLSYLAPHIRQALKSMQLTRLFPVQTAVVPWILNAHYKPFPFRPRDICVSAPTGSGKTLAFAIPLVQLLAPRVIPKIRALIVLPVAELALQVFKVFKKLCEKTDLNVCLLSKQFPFALEQQKLLQLHDDGVYHSKVDILVTTPGRLVDHLHATKGFCLKYLKFLVIDEADRIMDAVFQNWLYHLDSHVRNTTDQLLSGRSAPLCYNELLRSAHVEPHKLLFSATLSQDPEKLQNLRLFHPKLFTSVSIDVQQLSNNNNVVDAQQATGEFVGKYTTPAELTEKYCLTETRLKPLTLYSLITEQKWQKFLCFTNSAEAASRLSFVLKRLLKNGGMCIDELSATLNANERAKTLRKFMKGEINGLICSDALARGIDIPDVDIVISYEAPRHIKTYIHRIGRTARAGRPGIAITLLSQTELEAFNKILAEAGKAVNEEIHVASTIEENHATQYAEALKDLRMEVEKQKREKATLKKRAKQNAPIKQDPSQMTLMQKLQLQAQQKAVELAEQRSEKIETKQEKKKQLSRKVQKRNKTN